MNLAKYQKPRFYEDFCEIPRRERAPRCADSRRDTLRLFPLLNARRTFIYNLRGTN